MMVIMLKMQIASIDLKYNAENIRLSDSHSDEKY